MCDPVPGLSRVKPNPCSSVDTEPMAAGSVMMIASYQSDLADRARDAVAADATFVDDNAGHSNYVAYVLGGLMISAGLLAFVVADGSPTMSRNVTTTGSIVQSAPAR